VFGKIIPIAEKAAFENGQRGVKASMSYLTKYADIAVDGESILLLDL